MPQQLLPAVPELFVHQAVDMVKVNRLERLEKLVRGVEEPRLVFPRQALDFFQPGAPDARHLRVFHEGLGHFPDGRCGRILRGDPGDACAAVHFLGQIKHRQNDGDGTEIAKPR